MKCVIDERRMEGHQHGDPQPKPGSHFKKKALIFFRMHGIK